VETDRTWQRLGAESSKAHAAFLVYMRLPPNERSIDAAWRATNQHQTSTEKRATGQWKLWSSQHAWVARAAEHDAHVARLEQDAEDAKWVERRLRLRERDWTQGEALRRIFDESLPHAQGFIRSKTAHIPAQGDAPARVVITMAFDITGLAAVLERASKLQRLACGNVTDHTELSGAALNILVKYEIDRLTDPNHPDNQT